MNRIRGIYAIECMVNNKLYIGSSCNVNKRLATHKSELFYHKHPNIHLQRSWNRYGEFEFRFYLLESVDEDVNLWDRENEWISSFDTINSGYNMKIAGANYNTSRLISETELSKIRSKNLGRKYSPERLERHRKLGAERVGRNKRPDMDARNKERAINNKGMLVALDESGFIVMSFMTAHDAKKFGYGGVVEAMGKGHRTGGFTWRYIKPVHNGL